MVIGCQRLSDASWSPFYRPWSRHPFLLRDHVQCIVYALAFTGTHATYPQRDGQAELTWVAGYIARWFAHTKKVTHPSTNRARRRVTSLIETKPPPAVTWSGKNVAHDVVVETMFRRSGATRRTRCERREFSGTSSSPAPARRTDRRRLSLVLERKTIPWRQILVVVLISIFSSSSLGYFHRSDVLLRPAVHAVTVARTTSDFQRPV